MKTSLKPVSDKIIAVTDLLTVLTSRKNEIREQGEVIKEKIHVMVEEMIDVLRQSERQLTREVDTVTNAKLQILSEQTKSAEMSLNQLKDCQEFVEQSLEVGSPQQVLRSTKQMMKRTSHVTQQVNIEELNPKEKADIYFIKDSNIFDTLHHIGDIVHLLPSVLEQCKVKKIDRHHITTTDKTVTFPLSVQCSDSSLLIVPISLLSCSVVPVGMTTPIKASVTTTTHPGVYTTQCNLVSRGRHQVNVDINGVQVEGTSLVIPFNPYLDNVTPVCTIPELKRPCGIAITNNGSIIVSEQSGHCLTVLDKDRKKIKSFGQKGIESGYVKFNCPRGIAITSDNFIIIADNHKIQKISMEGKRITSIGKQGSGPLDFNDPRGITISPITGHIYIVDYNNHRIRVLNPDLTFSNIFGTKGSAGGQFNSPTDIAIDRRGLIYVADKYNNRIQKFTPNGQFLSLFGTEGSGPGELNLPSGIVLDENDLIYITEDAPNHRISIFTTDGQFIRSFGEHGSSSSICQFKNPCGIAFDKEGYLYICDMCNHRLMVC